MAHHPIRDGEAVPVIVIANRIEYVGGPRGGLFEDRADMPDSIDIEAGLYRRSVRCAEDGAMRYVWQGPALPGKKD